MAHPFLPRTAASRPSHQVERERRGVDEDEEGRREEMMKLESEKRDGAMRSIFCGPGFFGRGKKLSAYTTTVVPYCAGMNVATQPSLLTVISLSSIQMCLQLPYT